MNKQKVRLFISISLLVIGLLVKLVTTTFLPEGTVKIMGLSLGWGIAAIGLVLLILNIKK